MHGLIVYLLQAKVVIKNSVAGTLTDTDGMFRLEAGRLDTLIFSYIGMTVQEVPLIDCKETPVSVILSPRAQESDPLLVVGYAGSEEGKPNTGQVRAAETGRATVFLKNRKERVIKKEEADSLGFFVASERMRFKPEKHKNTVYMIDGKAAGRNRYEKLNTKDVLSVSIQREEAATTGESGIHAAKERVEVMTIKKK